jgi:hypothetical protein
VGNVAAMDCPVQKTSKIQVSKHNIKHILHRVEEESGFRGFMQILMKIFNQQNQQKCSRKTQFRPPKFAKADLQV